LGKRHGRRVQHAGFVVLKAPDIPSMLIETGFISSPHDERNLTDPDYQERMAGAVLAGIKGYFEQSPPPGTYLAQRQRRERRHVISAGDTLSEIADLYEVSLATLRRENAIKNDRRIRVGQILRIPST
jgi:N-acetylmuramoyl-L-alanine amidase